MSLKISLFCSFIFTKIARILDFMVTLEERTNMHHSEAAECCRNHSDQDISDT